MRMIIAIILILIFIFFIYALFSTSGKADKRAEEYFKKNKLHLANPNPQDED